MTKITPTSPAVPSTIANLNPVPEPLGGGEFVAVVQNGVTYKATIVQVAVPGQKAFKYYPSTVVFYNSYDRSTPLTCDTADFDDYPPGTFDIVNHCFVAPYAMRMEFYVNLLWYNPPTGAGMSALIMHNELGTSGGAPGGESGGADLTAYNPNNDNISIQVTQILTLAAGDKVWAVPCIASGSGLDLAPSLDSNGNVIVNYFTGKELRTL